MCRHLALGSTSTPTEATVALVVFFVNVRGFLSTSAPVYYPVGESTHRLLACCSAVVSDGKPIPGGVGGTSASAPVFAAIVALLNEARVQAGKPVMGLISPFIYAHPAAFTDITVGSDKVGRGGGVLEYGYNCSAGWDPVTGVGTPKFDELLKAAMAVVA